MSSKSQKHQNDYAEKIPKKSAPKEVHKPDVKASGAIKQPQSRSFNPASQK